MLNAKRSALLLLVFAISAATWVASSKYYSTRAAEAQQAVSARDQKIMDVIVRRNPNATIREFAGFPAVLIAEAARQGVDYRYVMAVIDKESEWNPRAVSPAGAVGLMQVMPATGAMVAKRLGLAFDPPSKASLGTLGDPAANLKIGTAHLRWLMDQYGLGPEHLRAYNRGDVSARAHWPGDRYAEDVAFRFVALSATGGLRDPAASEKKLEPAPFGPSRQSALTPPPSPKRPDAVSAAEAPRVPASAARVAGETTARGLAALMAATAARFPSLVAHGEQKTRGLPTLVFQAPERDEGGILLPRRFHVMRRILE